MSIYWQGMKVKQFYLSGCDSEGKLNEILSKQADFPHFKIYDIQMVLDQCRHYAWIFYKGDFPTDKGEERST